MSLIELDKPQDQWLMKHAASIDDRRNALGSIEAVSIENAGHIIESAINSKGISAYCYSKCLGDYQTFRIELNDCSLVQEVKSLQRSNLTHYPIGLYLEQTSQNHYMVWIYRTISKKALTYIRKFLNGKLSISLFRIVPSP